MQSRSQTNIFVSFISTTETFKRNRNFEWNSQQQNKWQIEEARVVKIEYTRSSPIKGAFG